MIFDSNGNKVASRYRMGIFDWLVILAVAEVAFFASCVPALGAVDPRCPQPAGLFSSSVVSGANVVCLVDVPTPTSYALWAVPAVGAPVRLSQTMPDNRDVIAFQVSADRVAYTADPNVWTQYELYSVPISGGSPVKLSGAMPSDNDVDDFAFAGGRVVYRKGRNATGVWNLFSAPVTGGGSAQLSQPNMSAVQRGFTVRSEERRLGKECISRWSPDH